MNALAPGVELFIPGLGFRPAAGALTLARPVEIAHDGVSLWLGRCVSAGRTDLDCAFTGLELPEEEPVGLAACAVPWWRGLSLELRDASGVHRGERIRGGGRSTRRSLSASFDGLAPETREAELAIDGPFGSWRLLFELVPLADVAIATALDVSAQDAGVTLAATALARGPDYTAVRVVATPAPPLRRVDGLGRTADPADGRALALSVGPSGQRCELRGRVGATLIEKRALEETLVFGPLPPDAREVVLRVDCVRVEEEAEPCPIPFPPAVGEYRFGRFSLRVLSAKSDLTHRQGSAVILECDVQGVDGRWLSRLSVEVDGASALTGWSRSPTVPLGLSILHPGYEPFTMTLRHPVVETRGHWELSLRV